MDGQAARLVIVDDAIPFVTALAAFCRDNANLSVVAHAHSLGEARAVLRRHEPHVVLLDHHLPDGQGVDFIPELRRLQPRAAVVILTAFEDDALIARAIDQGAAGYVLKGGGPYEAIAAVNAALQGGGAFNGPVARRVLELFRRRHAPEAPPASLSPQESRLLEALGTGTSLKEAAAAIGITYATARSYLRSIYTKLGVKSQLQAVLRFLGRDRIARA